MKEVRIGIIGGGAMGREAASALARWCALEDVCVRPVLTAVADPRAETRSWFKRVASCTRQVADYRELLADSEIDMVYVAVPHHLHEQIYCDVLAAGKDLFGEKSFGIDLGSAERIAEAARQSGRFVRCVSQMPFFPGAQRVYQMAQHGTLGRVLEINAGFLHSSDLNPDKPGNWKRVTAFCGEAGVMNDMGMHTCHLPLRLGVKPRQVFAHLQKGQAARPDGSGGTMKCDTWDNATLQMRAEFRDDVIPFRLEMKRLAPGAMNTWFIEIIGSECSARFSTAEPKVLWLFKREAEQGWKRVELGFDTLFRVVTGSIFEPGFPDAYQQMWAACLMEREGRLGERFGCATLDEALATHRLITAALSSQHKGSAVFLGQQSDSSGLQKRPGDTACASNGHAVDSSIIS